MKINSLNTWSLKWSWYASTHQQEVISEFSFSLIIITTSWGFDRPWGQLSSSPTPPYPLRQRTVPAVIGDCEISETPQACVLGEERAMPMSLSKPWLLGHVGMCRVTRTKGQAGGMTTQPGWNREDGLPPLSSGHGKVGRVHTPSTGVHRLWRCPLFLLSSRSFLLQGFNWEL